MRIPKGLWAAAVLVLSGAAYGQNSNNPNPTTLPSYPQPPAMPELPNIGAAAPATEAVPMPATAPAAATELAPAPTAAASAPASQPATQPAMERPTTGRLAKIVVTSNLDDAIAAVAPSLGAGTYSIGLEQIQATPQGDNAPFQQVLLRAPGVVPDSYGQEHVRGEHANLTYRINGVILPDGLNGFGQEIDTRLIESLTLIDGTLPAQFGFRTAGIADVTTKTGAELNGGELSLYGGSYDTFEPSVSAGGTSGKWDYFVTSSYKHDDLGIENPTPNLTAIHDDTDQRRFFGYFSYHIDDTSRVSLLLNASDSDFQIPNTPGLPQAYTLTGVPVASSADLNESQNEQDYYAVVAYQATSDVLSYQASAYVRYGQIDFTPDPVGDLIFQGTAGQLINGFLSTGVQLDGSYLLNDHHTVRGGLLVNNTTETLDSSTLVFPADSSGNQTSSTPETIDDDSGNHGVMSGIYLQDEWRITPSVTVNYGLRYDRFDANFDTEDQVSPRINLVWKIDKATTYHVGYARYFVPPPMQNVAPSTIAKFADTTNTPDNFTDDPSKVERSHYFDMGLSRQITKEWLVNVDGFYKIAHNLVDEGQFGQAPILTPFNYEEGFVYGTELSSTYKVDRWSLFGNFSWVRAMGKGIDSQEFTIDSAELAYAQSHYIHLDHESEFTVSAGISCQITKNDLAYLDVLYGSGLRTGFDNLDEEPNYYPVNVGYEHVFHVDGTGKSAVKLRCDVVNVLDESYQIRSGSGIGVESPQYGQRRTFLVGLAYEF